MPVNGDDLPHRLCGARRSSTSCSHRLRGPAHRPLRPVRLREREEVQGVLRSKYGLISTNPVWGSKQATYGAMEDKSDGSESSLPQRPLSLRQREEVQALLLAEGGRSPSTPTIAYDHRPARQAEEAPGIPD